MVMIQSTFQTFTFTSILYAKDKENASRGNKRQSNDRILFASLKHV